MLLEIKMGEKDGEMEGKDALCGCMVESGRKQHSHLSAGRKHCRSQAGRDLCSVLKGVKGHMSCPIQMLQPPSSDDLQHNTAGDASDLAFCPTNGQEQQTTEEYLLFKKCQALARFGTTSSKTNLT